MIQTLVRVVDSERRAQAVCGRVQLIRGVQNISMECANLVTARIYATGARLDEIHGSSKRWHRMRPNDAGRYEGLEF